MPRGLEPVVAVDLVVADDVAHAVGEDLRAAAGQRIDARFLQLLQGLANRELGASREIRDLDHGERFDVDLREALLEAADEVEEILKRQIGMQSADDVKLGDRFGVSGGGRLPRFFERHGVGAGRVLLAAEGAETAGGYTDVGWIDVPVDIEIRRCRRASVRGRRFASQPTARISPVR